MKYGFLLRSSTISKYLLSCLLNQDAFVAALDTVMADHHHISDEDIYEVLKTLYYPRWRAHDRAIDAVVMYRALRHYAEHHLGDARAWEQEFIELDEAGATEY